MTLPTEKTKPQLEAATAKVLLYGAPKIGKTTLAAGIDPEHTLFIATEPGLGAQSVYAQSVTDWDGFLAVCKELVKVNEHPFKTVVIDTVDNLAKFCQDHVAKKLNITHPSDLEYGKGWDALGTEFRTKVGGLSSLGLGVWFISHSKAEEVKQRVGSITVQTPTIGGSTRKFLVGFCDYIFYVEAQQTEGGEVRQIRTQATENFEAGGRVSLPDPIDLDAGELTKALAEAAASLTGEAVPV